MVVLVKLRNIETWLRRQRVRLSKRIAGTRRGRKILLDFLPSSIVEVTVDCGDHRITVVPHEMIGRHVFATGSYTRGAVDNVVGELDRIGALPKTGGCVLEIGANIGTHTLYLALSGRFDTIVAIEPDPRNLALLRRNLAANGFDGIARVMTCAAGEEEGELTLHRIDGNYGNSSFLHARPTGDGVIVPVRPVDAILRDAEVDQSEVSLVWMDIEGFEPQACRSMRPLLERQVPIYAEFSPAFYGPEGTRAFVGFLSRYYADCVVFNRTGRHAMQVAELAGETRQCDVLLLPVSN